MRLGYLPSGKIRRGRVVTDASEKRMSAMQKLSKRLWESAFTGGEIAVGRGIRVR